MIKEPNCSDFPSYKEFAHAELLYKNMVIEQLKRETYALKCKVAKYEAEKECPGGLNGEGGPWFESRGCN